MIEPACQVDRGAMLAPAAFCNRFQAMQINGLVRIAFGEHMPGDCVYRFATIMTAHGARELAAALVIAAGNAPQAESPALIEWGPGTRQ